MKQKVIYWTVTLLFVLPMMLGGIPELLFAGPDAVVQNMNRLGYPLYVLHILGFFKVSGGLVILANRPRWLKEWAYAGFVFELMGAAASHVLAKDPLSQAIPALVLLAFVIVSYRLWHTQELSSSQP